MTSSRQHVHERQSPQPAHDPNAFVSVVKTFLMVAAAAILVHIAVVSIWLAPGSQIEQTLGSSNTADADTTPVHNQDGSQALSNPEALEVEVAVRATMEDPDTEAQTTTEWDDVTDLANIRHAADGLHLNQQQLNPSQAELVQSDSTDEPIDGLHQELVAASSDETTWYVERYADHEQAAVDLATAYAEHTWDGDVVKVQLRTASDSVPVDQWANPETPNAREPSWHTYGWRAPAKLTEHELAHFGRQLE